MALLPQFAAGQWTGSGARRGTEAEGRYLVIEWFGFVWEINWGRVR